MIFSTVQPEYWSGEHAKLLRDFLESEVGKLALQWVAFSSPDLLDGSDVNKTLVASGQVKGYAQAIEQLFSLTKEQPPEVKSFDNYPPLDLNSAWGDSLQDSPQPSK